MCLGLLSYQVFSVCTCSLVRKKSASILIGQDRTVSFRNPSHERTEKQPTLNSTIEIKISLRRYGL